MANAPLQHGKVSSTTSFRSEREDQARSPWQGQGEGAMTVECSFAMFCLYQLDFGLAICFEDLGNWEWQDKVGSSHRACKWCRMRLGLGARIQWPSRPLLSFLSIATISYLLTAWQTSMSSPYSFTIIAKSVRSIQFQGWWAVLCLGKAGWYPQKVESSEWSSKNEAARSNCFDYVWTILNNCDPHQSMICVERFGQLRVFLFFNMAPRLAPGLSALPRQLFSLSPEEILWQELGTFWNHSKSFESPPWISLGNSRTGTFGLLLHISHFHCCASAAPAFPLEDLEARVMRAACSMSYKTGILHMTAEYSGDQGPGSGSKRVKWMGSRYVGNLALFSGTKSERRSATQKSQWSLTALIVAQVTDIIGCCSVPFHHFQAFHFYFQDLLGVRKNTCVGFLTNLLVLFMWKAWWESELGFCRIGFILQISFPLKIKEFCGCLALL